ncbi:MAG: TAXI family TRAP transporter solute-binding subunit [Rhodospirillaceae bacterium]|nr:TAXI family TRAP transporter solute-binding subunit [Rhodospirillaceae bacterium]
MVRTILKAKSAFGVFALVLAALLMPNSVTAKDKESNFITIGTGSVTGVYYPAGGSICHLLNRGRAEHGIRCSVESSSGSVENIENIISGNVDFGIVQSDTQYQAVNGVSAFTAAGPNDQLRAVMSLYYESFTLVARSDSGIKSLADLPGKRVNIGNNGSGQRGTMEIVMQAMGWSNDTFSEVHELKASEQSRALCDGTIDAMVYMVGHPNASIKEATALCDSVLIDVAGPEISNLVNEHEYYSYVSMPGSMYRGTSGETNSFGVGATLLTSINAAEDVVYELTKAVFENIEIFRELHPAFSMVDVEKMVSESLSAPLHPGALKYYREIGLIK